MKGFAFVVHKVKTNRKCGNPLSRLTRVCYVPHRVQLCRYFFSQVLWRRVSIEARVTPQTVFHSCINFPLNKIGKFLFLLRSNLVSVLPQVESVTKWSPNFK